MSGVEKISKCPKCGSPALSKWESSSCGFMFDACPSCLFLHHHVFNTCITSSRVSTWQVILNAYNTSISKLREELKSYTPDQLETPAFNYEKCSIQEMEAHTKLGGERLYNTNPPAYRENYDYAHQSTRFHNKLEKERLQNMLQFGGFITSPYDLIRQAMQEACNDTVMFDIPF